MSQEQGSFTLGLSTHLPRTWREKGFQKLDQVSRNTIPLGMSRELFLASSLNEVGMARAQLSQQVSVEIQEEGAKKPTIIKKSLIIFEVSDSTGRGENEQTEGNYWLEFHAINGDKLIKVRYSPSGQKQILPEMEQPGKQLMRKIIKQKILPNINNPDNEIIPSEINFDETQSKFINMVNIPLDGIRPSFVKSLNTILLIKASAYNFLVVPEKSPVV